jgi:hypothetical protein
MTVTEEITTSLERLDAMSTQAGLPIGGVNRLFKAVFEHLQGGGDFDVFARDIAAMPVQVEPGKSRLFVDKLYAAAARYAQAAALYEAGNERDAWRAMYCASLDHGGAMAVQVASLERVHIGKKRGKAGANARHDRPGGSRDKVAQIRAIWASGKYTSKTLCAEQEWAGLNWNFNSAVRALKNQPDPHKK